MTGITQYIRSDNGNNLACFFSLLILPAAYILNGNTENVHRRQGE